MQGLYPPREAPVPALGCPCVGWLQAWLPLEAVSWALCERVCAVLPLSLRAPLLWPRPAHRAVVQGVEKRTEEPIGFILQPDKRCASEPGQAWGHAGASDRGHRGGVY